MIKELGFAVAPGSHTLVAIKFSKVSRICAELMHILLIMCIDKLSWIFVIDLSMLLLHSTRVDFLNIHDHVF